jgi:NADH:ubiquinone reductase (non-electrogenic)
MKNILLVGSGWGGSSFVKHIDTNKYNVTVISMNEHFTYTPLLPTSIFFNMNLKYKINELNKINFIKDEVKQIDFKDNKIELNKKNIKYDYLVLAHGSTVNTFNIPGVKENCLFLKDENDVESIKKKLANLPFGSKIAVIGCGLTGSEIIGNLIDTKKYQISAIDGLKVPIPLFDKSISDYTLNTWCKNNVNLLFNNFVNRIDDKNIYFKNNSIKYDLAFWCGGIKPSILTTNINNQLMLKCRFGIPVSNYLKVNNTKNVYAIGDCGYSNNPPTAQVAYQEGRYLANNFNNDFQNMKPFNFQNKGQICYIGEGKSVYQNNYFSGKGKIIGYLNNFIHVYNAINFDQMVTFTKNIFK